MKTHYTLLLIFSYFLSFSQGNIEVMGNYVYPPDVHCSGITGYSTSDGKEYALVSTTNGLDIIDVTIPATPVFIANCPYPSKSVRVYKQYAYSTYEGGEGLTVINLSQLALGQINYLQVLSQVARWQHTIFIDENGIAYLNGTNGGLKMLDLNVNPWTPEVIGSYTNTYVHDCYVRNDTMWAACIFEGQVRVIDVHDKTKADSASSLIASWNTPANYTHNTWLSDDGNYLFTTDERTPSYLACYDVSDLTNVVETDRILLQNDNTAILHNVNYKDGYCYSAGYTYGFVIHNVANKHNIIEEARYDTSPRTGTSFWGNYDVWPYLPSGYILATDAETGLWIFRSNTINACYISGTVTNKVCSNLLYNAEVNILQSATATTTNLSGVYNTFTYDTIPISIRFSAAGYHDTIVQVTPVRGITLNIDVQLSAVQPMGVFTTICKDKQTQQPIQANFILRKADSDSISAILNTNTNGEYSYCGLPAGHYVLYAGKWGYITDSVNLTIGADNDSTIVLLEKGYYDDFLFNYPWTRESFSANTWVCAEPIGTMYNGSLCNPDADVLTDFGKRCYVTGNIGATAEANDLDAPAVELLTSPQIDLTNYADPVLSFYQWYINGHTNEANDWFRVIAKYGTESKVLSETAPGNIIPGWVKKTIRLRDYIPTNENFVTINFAAIDIEPGNITEAAIDVFEVYDGLPNAIGEIELAESILIYPNPFSSQLTISLKQPVSELLAIDIYDMAGNKITKETIPTGSSHVAVSPNLAAGVYVLKAFNSTNSCTTRIVKLD